jgi:hypothetical protein
MTSVFGNQALKKETEIGAKFSGNRAELLRQFSTVFILYRTMYLLNNRQSEYNTNQLS